MRSLFQFLFIALIFSGRSSAQSPGADYFPDRVFVKVNPESGINLPVFTANPENLTAGHIAGLPELIQEYSISRIAKPFRTPDPRLQCIYELRFNAAGKLGNLVADLSALPWVSYAEAVPVYRMDFTPDDLNFLQWYLPKIKAEEAWDISTGSTDVVVAIVDNAVRYTHEDLAPNVWVNPNEIPLNSNDDDNNGYVDDINGWDAANEDNDPAPPPGSNFDHGSHVAGIASAATNNGKGIAGIGYQVKLMCVKTKLDTTSGPELDNTFGGVDYAIAAGADVVNMSFGGMGYSSTFASLIQVGHDSGMVFVASAGNDGQFTQRFPAGYPYVISVGSTGFDDSKSSFSNYHMSVDVMAPGSNVWSCMGDANTSYGFMSGTSMSAPLTAGLAALILSVNDTLDPDEVEQCLEAGCDNIDAVNADYVGYIGAGRINAYNSLLCAQGVTISSDPAHSFSLNPPYPQPAVSSVIFSATFPSAENIRLNLYDARGRWLNALFEGSVTGRMELQWDCSVYPAGIYFAEWETAQGKEVQRVAVIR